MIKTYFLIGILAIISGVILRAHYLGYVLIVFGLLICIVNIFSYIYGKTNKKNTMEKYAIYIIVILTAVFAYLIYSFPCPDRYIGSGCSGDDGLDCLDKAIIYPNGNITFKAKNFGDPFEFTG